MILRASAINHIIGHKLANLDVYVYIYKFSPAPLILSAKSY